MKVEKDKVVGLTYELTVDGKIADRATEERPLEYIHGNHMLLPKFEAEVEGLEKGGEFAFTLSPAEGYGEYNPSMVFNLPMESFMIEGRIPEGLLVEGRVIPMLDSNGHVMQGTVRGFEGDRVKMDFNHPMAGKTLNFTGKVVAVRDATEKELTEGLHGEYLPPEKHHHRCGKKGHGEGECCKDKGDCHEGEGCCHDKE
ncbi:MAG: peptidylprolyl isomerase [Bacteroidales bacterium]|nr:peptidylprolyl isomerase [Bacteroidales bacterium]